MILSRDIAYYSAGIRSFMLFDTFTLVRMSRVSESPCPLHSVVFHPPIINNSSILIIAGRGGGGGGNVSSVGTLEANFGGKPRVVSNMRGEVLRCRDITELNEVSGF